MKKFFTNIRIMALLLGLMSVSAVHATVYKDYTVNVNALKAGDILLEGTTVNYTTSTGYQETIGIVFNANKYGLSENSCSTEEAKIYGQKSFTVGTNGVISIGGDNYYPYLATQNPNSWKVTEVTGAGWVYLEGNDFDMLSNLWKGVGDEANPFEIWNEMDWRWIHTKMMNMTSNDVFGNRYTHFKQMADFTITQGIGVTGSGHSKSFGAVYNGDGHTLTCNISGDSEAAAPFYQLNGAYIHNLNVAGTISGGIHSAGLAAYTDNATIKNCRVSASITCTGGSNNDAHGAGVVGHARESNLTVNNCLFDGTLTATSNGLGDIRLGAIVGWGGENANVQVTNCLENGTYNGTTSNSQKAFCWKYNNGAGTTIDDISNCCHISAFDDDRTSGSIRLYKVVSGTDGLTVNPKENITNIVEFGDYSYSTTENGNFIINSTFYAKKDNTVMFKIGYDDAILSLSNLKVNDTAPTATDTEKVYTFTQTAAESIITATLDIIHWTDEGYYADAYATVDNTKKIATISTAAQLARLAHQVYSGEDSGEGWTYLLTEDLNMSQYEWTPIGNGMITRFRGTFNGQNHKISGVHVANTDRYVALFGVVNGTVENLKLTNSQFEGRQNVGGIAGEVRGKIQNCYVGNDVTVKAVVTDDSDSGNDCGGVVGSIQSQNQTTNYPASEAEILGCYSGATVSGKSHVGGIVGLQYSNGGTVHQNVSMANVSATGDDGSVAYTIGNIKSGGISEQNFYVADEASDNSIDVRGYLIDFSDELKELGFEVDYNYSNNIAHVTSGITFAQRSVYDADGLGQIYWFKCEGKWYGYAGRHLYVDVPTVYGGLDLENVKLNGESLQPTLGTSGYEPRYYFNITDNSIITGNLVMTLDNNNPKNSTMIEKVNGKTLNVKLADRTLYTDGCWNTLCLPFDLTIKDSQFEDVAYKLRTLVSSDFDNMTGKLTLTFNTEYDNLKTIEAGKPYIIWWREENNKPDIVNPEFENVTINSTITPIATKYVDFVGNYSPVDLETNDKSVLYLGADDYLYYPTEDMTIGACRAYFMLKGITAGDLPENGVNVIMNFDGESTAIQTINNGQWSMDNGQWYTIDGRKLNDRPTQKGLYIHGGKKMWVH